MKSKITIAFVLCCMLCSRATAQVKKPGINAGLYVQDNFIESAIIIFSVSLQN